MVNILILRPIRSARTRPSRCKEVDNIVGRINGRFATLSWTPVRHFYKPFAYADVVAWYDAASIAWITL